MRAASPGIRFDEDLGRALATPRVSVPRVGTVSFSSERISIMLGVAIAVAYTVAAALSMEGIASGFAVAALGAAVLSPVAGLAAAALIIPVREIGVLPLNFAFLLIAASALGCVFRIPRDSKPLYVHPGAVLAFGFGILSLLSVLPSISGYPDIWLPEMAAQLSGVLGGLGLFFVAAYVFRSTSSIPILCIAVGGAVFAGAVALLAYWQTGPLHLVGGLLAPTEGSRATGGFTTANYLGCFMAQAALLSLGLLSVVGRTQRMLLVVGAAILLAALVLSFSRSSLIGLAVGLFVLAWFHDRRLAVAVAAVAIVGGATLYPTISEARTGGVVGPSTVLGQAQSVYWREVAFAAGVSLFLTAPIFGTGFGSFQFLSSPYVGASPATASHNAYIQLLAEQGLVGGAIVAAFLALLLVALVRSSSPARPAAIAMLACYLVQAWFINAPTSIQASGLTWLALAAGVMVVDKRRPAVRGTI